MSKGPSASADECRRGTAASPHWHVHTDSEPSWQPANLHLVHPASSLKQSRLPRPAGLHPLCFTEHVTHIVGCVGNACAYPYTTSTRSSKYIPRTSHAGRDRPRQQNHSNLSAPHLVPSRLSGLTATPLQSRRANGWSRLGYLKRICCTTLYWPEPLLYFVCELFNK